jgi:hypothetical protein
VRIPREVDRYEIQPLERFSREVEMIRVYDMGGNEIYVVQLFAKLEVLYPREAGIQSR